MTIISTKRLTKFYSKKRVVSELNLDIKEGTVFGFLGPNGAGKTTTIRMLLGLIRPSYGSAEMLGHDVNTSYHKIAESIAAIVEHPTFFPYLNAIQTLQTFADYCGVEKSKKALEQLLDQSGILYAANQKVESFSLGMKQRLGIATALINDPKIIFLDEPTNGLDPKGIIQTRELIRHLSEEENKTVFLSSHLLNEVEQICDEVAILNHGEIKVTGLVSDLLQNKRIVLSATPVKKTKKLLETFFPTKEISLDQETDKFSFDLDLTEVPSLLEKLSKQKITVYEVFQSAQTLEEFFHQTIK